MNCKLLPATLKFLSHKRIWNIETTLKCWKNINTHTHETADVTKLTIAGTWRVECTNFLTVQLHRHFYRNFCVCKHICCNEIHTLWYVHCNGIMLKYVIYVLQICVSDNSLVLPRRRKFAICGETAEVRCHKRTSCKNACRHIYMVYICTYAF